MGLLSVNKRSEKSLLNNINSVLLNMGFGLTDVAKAIGHIMPKFPSHSRKFTLPTDFDSRNYVPWSGCIHPVRD